MVRKQKDLTLVVNEKTVDLGEVETNFYTEDKGIASFRFMLRYDNSYIDLIDNGYIPELDLFHSDGSIWMNEPLISIIPRRGLLQYSVPDNVIIHAGKVDAKVFLKNGANSIHVANFSFNIIDSGITGAVEKEISVNLIENTIRDIIQEEALEILGPDFVDEVSGSLHDYVIANPDHFKGVQGETGIQGIKGDKGDKGDTGLQGEQGVQGIQGERGLQGMQGSKGDKGDAGIDGTMTFEELSEEQKLTLKGDTGEQGIQGEQGPKGDTGPTGADGIQGVQGPAGLDGVNGTNPNPIDVINQINDINNKISFNNVNLKTILNSKVPLQSFIYTGNEIYGLRNEPTLTRNKEDITLMRFSESGTYLDSMKLLGVSHIENAGYKDGFLYFVFYSTDGAAKRLIKFKYIKDATVAYETAVSANVIRPSLNISSEVNKVNINIYNNTLNMMYYNGDTAGITLKAYDLTNLSLLQTRTVATDVNISWLQGCVASNEHIYVMVGDYVLANTKQIRKYSISDGSLVEVKDISTIGADDIGSLPLNDWLEPEGLQIYQKDGKDILMQGVFTGGSNTIPTQKRFKIYEYNNETTNRGDHLAYQLSSDSMIYDGPSIQGNNTGTFSMIETAKNYKFLTFYYTAGVAGTHTVTVPTDLLKLVKYVDCECRAITATSELYTYITRFTFEDDLKRFSITNSRMLKVNIATPASSSTTSNNYAGFYLYKIKGHQTYSEFDV